MEGRAALERILFGGLVVGPVGKEREVSQCTFDNGFSLVKIERYALRSLPWSSLLPLGRKGGLDRCARMGS